MRGIRKTGQGVLVCALAMIVVGQATWAASVQGLGTGVVPAAISADGSVIVGQVGYSGLIWTESGGVRLLEGTFNALGVSADGRIVVGSTNDTVKTGYYWSSASGLVPIPGTMWMIGASVDGRVLAGQTTKPRNVARWEDGVLTALGTLGDYPSSPAAMSPDGRVIIGQSKSPNGNEAFRWTASEGMVGLGDLAGWEFYSAATGVSADGSVVVGRGMAEAGFEAFLWTAATGMVGLGDLAGGDYFSMATSVSADGSLIAGFSSTVNGYEAFVWDAANGMRNLKDVLTSVYQVEVGDWILTDAYISADGRAFTGTRRNSAGQTEGWRVRLPDPQPPQPDDPPTPAVPLPAAMWAGGAMLLGVVLRPRRPRHR